MTIEYSNLPCRGCMDITSHVIVDTIDGKKWSCEICGSFSKISIDITEVEMGD